MAPEGIWKNKREGWFPDPAASRCAGRDAGTLPKLCSISDRERLGCSANSDRCLSCGCRFLKQIGLYVSIPFPWASGLWPLCHPSDRLHGVSEFHEIQFSTPIAF